MRLNKRDLAKKLGVSERILTTWQQEGMPVLEHGRRGQHNVYDLAAVVRWLRATARGIGRGGRRSIDLDAIEIELGGAPAVQTFAPAGPTSYAIARAITRSRVVWLEGLPGWDYLDRIPANDLTDLLGLYICELVRQLQAAGFTDLEQILDESCSYDAWPETFDEILERCRAEVPPLQAPW